MQRATVADVSHEDVDEVEDVAAVASPAVSAGAFGDPRAVVLRFAVPPDCDGKTAEELLAYHVRRLGLDRARSVVGSGDLRRAEAGPLVVGEVVRRGDGVELWRIAPDSADDAPSCTILHRRESEDGAVVVVDKPGDLAVHPSARYLHHTLTGFLRRAGIHANPCHRLDRETSGVLV